MESIISESELMDELYRVRHSLSGGLTGLYSAVDQMNLDERSNGPGQPLLWQSFVRLMTLVKELDERIAQRRADFARRVGAIFPES
jgi:hypothetical protein